MIFAPGLIFRDKPLVANVFLSVGFTLDMKCLHVYTPIQSKKIDATVTAFLNETVLIA